MSAVKGCVRYMIFVFDCYIYMSDATSIRLGEVVRDCSTQRVVCGWCCNFASSVLQFEVAVYYIYAQIVATTVNA